MHKWDHEARPSASHPHGSIPLSEEGRRLETDAMYFRTGPEALAWANDRKWPRFELTVAMGVA